MVNIIKIIVWVSVLATLILNRAIGAETLNVAVASNFKPALDKLIEPFERKHNVDVVVSFGSTGTLYAQISHGAPFDVFLAADKERPELLEQNQLITEGSRKTYAIGQLAYLSSGRDRINLAALKEFKGRVAIANPKTAPYGHAAQYFLTRNASHLLLNRHKVTANSIAQAFQFVSSGNVDGGFVALSQIIQMKRPGKYWLVPQRYYSPIVQQMVTLKRSEKQALAKQFTQYLLSKETQQKISSAGYQIFHESVGALFSG